MFWRRKKHNSEDTIKNDQNKASDEQFGNGAENLDEKSSKTKEPELASIDEENKSTADTPEENKTEDVYDIDDVIDGGGYGWYQRFVTLLAGMIWFTAAFQTMVMTIIGDYLSCSWKIYRWQYALLVSIVFLCMSVGSPFFGYLGDNYGRKKAIGSYLLIQFSFGAGASASNNVITMIILMAFMGFGLGGFSQVIAYICEFYPAKDRGIAGFYTAYFWNTGTLLLILISWGLMTAFNNWRWVMFISAFPSLLVLIGIRWFPESPRYYLVSQQVEKAQKKLAVMSRMNKVELPKGQLLHYRKNASEERGHFLDLFQPEHRKTILLMWYIWFSTVFTYYSYALITPFIIKYGTIRISEEMLKETVGVGNFTSHFYSVQPCKEFSNLNYIDLLWTTAAELPGLFIYSYLVIYINRNTLLSIGFFLSMFCTFLLIVDTKFRFVLNVFLFLGRANIIAMFQMIFIMTTEAFPTTLRGLAVGSCAGIGRMGAGIAPFAIRLLITYNGIAAICILGFMLFFGTISAASLPREMKDRTLKEITEEFDEPSKENVQSEIA
ncbi:synaptic vesicle 2-related protein [Nephila pilipes]|uniref:Synaptic vesicle 2-related protein n=1 Tax=Nephila pilipes TaxID=299642 RepID=A0A8X6UH24_NEPPI|nr:synaptic vesicle 2-related protein [Nephila pilipes]